MQRMCQTQVNKKEVEKIKQKHNVEAMTHEIIEKLLHVLNVHHAKTKVQQTRQVKDLKYKIVAKKYNTKDKIDILRKLSSRMETKLKEGFKTIKNVNEIIALNGINLQMNIQLNNYQNVIK